MLTELKFYKDFIVINLKLLLIRINSNQRLKLYKFLFQFSAISEKSAINLPFVTWHEEVCVYLIEAN